MTTFSFRQGIDYGPRDGTLGLSFHMAEGGDGTLGFLSRHPGETLAQWKARVRGVSCNALCLSDGTIWQMLDWGHASGNLNPADRASEYGYYGHHHLVDVLGDHWPDPNTWTISMEITGFRADGPTIAQRDAAIAWGREMRKLYPSLRGATGHHDQAPKPCPGLTPNMRAIFAGVGGHGLWTAEAVDMLGFTLDDTKPHHGSVAIAIDGVSAIRLDDKALIPVHKGEAKEHGGFGRLTDPFGTGSGDQADRQTGWLLYGPRPAWLLAYAGREVPVVAPAPDCTDPVAAEHERTRAADIAALQALP